MIILEIGYPPSNNRLWRHYRGRTIRDPAYVKWLDDQGKNIISQMQGGITGPYRLFVDVVKPDRRRRDLGNLEKSISDLLVYVGTVNDDSDAQEIHMKWVSDGPPVLVRVEKV